MISDEIADLFASYSEPDEFTYQAQLELFAWARLSANREHARASMARRYHTDEVYRARHKAASVARTKAKYASDPAFRERMKAYQRARYAKRRAA